MFNNQKFRTYFKVLRNKVNGFDLVYFDNGATSLKPDCVMETINDYYFNFPSNVHRSDFVYGHKATTLFEKARDEISTFFNCFREEIIFTSGATQSSNMVSNSFINILQKGDEIIVNKAEHASNLLGWFDVAKKTGAKIVYAPLDENDQLHLAAIQKVFTSKSKVLVFALTTNVVGDTRDFEGFWKWGRENNVITVVDAAQSLYLYDFDFKKIAPDFFFFSGHKIFGPTGIGVLMALKDSQKYLKVTSWGGGMNDKFNDLGNVLVKTSPYCYEAGTPNIAGALGLGKAFWFIKKWNSNEMRKYVYDLQAYAIERLQQNPYIKIHNPLVQGAIITFEFKDVFSQDVATYLSSKGIALRCGDHCAKLLQKNTIRISLAPYNTKAEIDFLIAHLHNKTLEDFISVFSEEKENG